MYNQYDALNKELEIGDRVVFSDSKREASNLKSGRVVGFTPKKIRIEVPNDPWRIQRMGEDIYKEIQKFPSQIAKVD